MEGFLEAVDARDGKALPPEQRLKALFLSLRLHLAELSLQVTRTVVLLHSNIPGEVAALEGHLLDGDLLPGEQAVWLGCIVLDAGGLVQEGLLGRCISVLFFEKVRDFRVHFNSNLI